MPIPLVFHHRNPELTASNILDPAPSPHLCGIPHIPNRSLWLWPTDSRITLIAESNFPDANCIFSFHSGAQSGVFPSALLLSGQVPPIPALLCMCCMARLNYTGMIDQPCILYCMRPPVLPGILDQVARPTMHTACVRPATHPDHPT